MSFPGEAHGTALQVASAEGHTNIVQMLLDKGADPNIKGSSENLT